MKSYYLIDRLVICTYYPILNRHWLLDRPKTHEQCLEDAHDRRLENYGYLLLLIFMLQIHKVEQTELLYSKLTLWLEDG